MNDGEKRQEPARRLEQFDAVLLRLGVSPLVAKPGDFKRATIFAADAHAARVQAQSPSGWTVIALTRPGEPTAAEIAARQREVEAQVADEERHDPRERPLPSFPG